MLALGIDPGLATLGLAEMEIFADSEQLRAMRTFTTKASPKKMHILANDDVFRRSREIVRVIEPLVRDVRVQVICFEAWSPIRNAGAAAKVARTFGIIAALAEVYSIPVVSPTPQQVKMASTGRRDASKETVQASIRKRYRKDAGVFKRFEKDTPKSRREHGYDACGIIVASLDSEVIRGLRRFFSAPD